MEKNGVEFLQFSNLKAYDGMITHCFTTRHGGVSTGECASLNLGLNRNDRRENVLENFNRICGALDIDSRNLVLTSQVHDNKVMTVDEGDRGKGLHKESDIKNCDGLLTNRRQVALAAFFADCVPVFLFDREKHVIGVVHSGWRGTVKEIAAEAVRKMGEAYGSKPADIMAAIGPSIGKCCFEVGNEVYSEFINKFGWSGEFCEKGPADKWYIDLAGIIKRMLTDCGLKEESVCVANICTKCRRDVFFSHRGDKGRTGNLAAIIQLL